MLENCESLQIWYMMLKQKQNIVYDKGILCHDQLTDTKHQRSLLLTWFYFNLWMDK